MHFGYRLSLYVSLLILSLPFTSCAPTKPGPSTLVITGNSGPFFNLPEHCGFGSFPNNRSGGVGIDHTTWKISNTISLAITICNWEPSPSTIAAVLLAAATAVSKKPAAGLLEEKFIQRSGNKYNNLYFEISPGYIYRRLTWGDVEKVLGENGLLKFYEATNQWHTVYFDMFHTTRGELGKGAVRRWWQLEEVGGVNGIASAL